MRISDWSSDVCSSDLDRDIFGASILREAVPACAQLEAVLAADDAIIGFGFLGLAGVGDDGDRRRNGEGGERAFEAAVVLHGEVSDSGHDKNSFGCSGTIPDGAQRRARLPTSP